MMRETISIIEFIGYGLVCFLSWSLFLSFLSYRIFNSKRITAMVWIGVGFVFSFLGFGFFWTPVYPQAFWSEQDHFRNHSHQVFMFAPLVLTIFLWGYLRVRIEDDAGDENTTGT